MAKKVLFVVGSSREKSFNMQLAKIAEKYLEGKAEVSFLSYGDVPFMNQDAEFPAPKAVARVRKAVMEADGVWFFNPEYNYSYPGVVKNLVDWLSRPLVEGDFSSGTAILKKKVTLSGVSGASAAKGSREKLDELLHKVRADVYPGSETGVALDRSAFMSNVLTLSDKSRNELESQADAFLTFLG